jgi:single-stranded-DNA-specific exonuclease
MRYILNSWCSGLGREVLINFIQREKSFRIIPSSDVDSLLASAILLKNLSQHGYDVKVSFDLKRIIDEPREPALLVSLKPVNPSTQAVLEPARDSSVTGTVVSVLDEYFGVDKWDKILAVVAGVYKALDTGRDGFKGVERNILNNLLEGGEISSELGFRLWGHRRIGLSKSLTRTLTPFIPGYTGAGDRVEELLRKISKGRPVEKPQATDFFTESGKQMLRDLVEALQNTVKAPQDYVKNAILRMIGFEYSTSVDTRRIDLLELAGALMVYASLEAENPLKILGATLQSVATQILAIYEEVVDELAAILASSIPRYLFEGEPVDVEDYLERADIIADVAGWYLPQVKTPASIIRGGRVYTVARELLRVGWDPRKVYESCDDKQLCVIQGGAV